MKKITLLILMTLFSIVGYSQFSENFDSAAAIPAGWTVTNNGLGLGQQWTYTGVAAQVNSAPGAVRLLNQTVTLADNVYEDWLITPAINLAAVSNPQLRFQVKSSLANNQGDKFRVMVSTTNTALASFTLVKEWHEFYTGDPDPANAVGTANNVYALNTADLTALAGGQATVYVAFVAVNQYDTTISPAGAGDNWFLDDVQVVQTCPDVTSPVAVATGQTTATLSWTNPGGAPTFDIEVVALPAAPTGTPTYVGVTNPYNVTGLTANTQYAYYVRSHCGTVTGNWVGPTNFTTPVNYCTGTHFYDPGGAAANYANNANVTTVICPSNPGDIVTVSFASFNTQANQDLLKVYDGPNATYPLLATLSGTTIPASISSNIGNGGCLTFVFTSNATTVAAGWDATVVCAPPPTCPRPTGLTVVGTTATTATLNWTPGLSETAWEIVVQAPGGGTPTGASTIIPAGTHPFTVTGLTSSTNYEYYVRAVCSSTDSSLWSGPMLFSTTQIPGTLNFSDNFEGASGFTLVNGAQTNKWIIGTAVNNGGTKSLYITNNGGTSNAYTVTTTSVVQAYRDIQVPAGVNLLNLSFDWRAVGESTFDYFRVWIVPTSFTPTAGTQITNGGAGYQQLAGLLNQGAAFTTASYDIPATGYAGQIIRLVFEWRNDNSAGTQPPAAIDNINMTIVTCPKPTALQVTAVSQNSATVTWTAGGTETQWELVVQPAGTGAPTGASTIIPVSAIPYTINGLNPSTNYEYYVRAVCSSTDSSLWAGPLPFSTTQIPATLNFSDNFEAASGFTLVNGTQTNKWVIGTAVNNGGTKSLYITNNGGAANAYTTTAATVVQAYRDIQVPAGVNLLNLSFDWRAVGESCCDYIRAWIVPITYTPTAGTQIAGGAGFQQLSANLNQGATFTTASYDIPATGYAGQIIRLAFEWRNDGSVGTQPPAAIDNINLTIVTCPKPTALQVTAVNQNSATITWTAGGTETQWELVVQPAGSGAPTGASTIIPVSAIPYTVNGLNPSTNYEYYVRAVCSSTDSSLWAGPKTFSTTQIPAIMNYVEDFESSPQWTFTNGTQTNKWIVGTATSNGGAQSLYISNNNAANAYTVSSTSVVHAYRDIQIPAGTNLMNLSFDWKAQGESSFDYLRVWTVPATFTPTPGTQITAASGGQQLSPNLGLSTPWVTQAYNLTGGTYSGQVMRLIFEWTNDSSGGTQPPAAVDNINLSIPACPPPYNLTTTSQSGSPIVTLNWTPGGAETQWTVVIQPQGGPVPTPATTGITVTGAPTYTFTATNGVFYEYYVMANCGSTSTSQWAGPFVFSVYAPPGCANVDVVGVGVNVVNNQVLLCPGQTSQNVQLAASYFGIGATTSYDVTSIAYNPPFPFTGGTQVSVGTDDVWSSDVNLPFNFCFFGNSYSKAKVGSNGVVGFGIPSATTYCPWSFSTTIPNATFPILNAIYGVYQDVDPTVSPAASGTTVNYQVLGNYPCRALVVNFANLNQFSCGTATGPQTSQVVLYEISNIIEVYVQRRVPCTGWQNGVGVIGIQNAAGTVAYTPPGRNTGSWSATNEAWRFTPNAPATINLEWLQNGVVIGTNSNVTVSVNDDTTVTAQATYVQCDGSTVTTSSNINIIVTEELPTLQPHDMFACSNDTNPTFDLTQNGDYVLSNSTAANYTINYYTTLAAAQAAVPGTQIPNPTAYVGTNGQTIYMNVTSNAGCTEIKSFVLSFSTTVPDYTLNGVTNGSLTVCQNNTATITVVPNNFDGATAFYEWADPNGVVLAETSGTLTLPAGSLSGNYTVTVSTGCKTTSTFAVNVVNVAGTINLPIANCANSLGTLVVSATGGTNYEYSFDGGVTYQTNNQYQGAPGTYQIVIRDIASGCISDVIQGVIADNPNAPDAPTLGAPVNETCSTDGQINVLNPLNGPVTYPNLFISEVTDANTGSLTYIEIYNRTGASVNLSGYKLRVFNNGSATASCDFALVGVLANGATHIVKVSSDANIPGVVPNQTVSTCSGVNIDDSIKLTTNTNVVVDVWGTPDGSVFTPAGQPGYTYRRIPTSTIPNSTWTPADWTTVDPEDYSNLGSYTPATTNYYYSLDNGTPQAGMSFTPVAPGNHIVTVVDMTTGCVSPGTAITIDGAQQPTITYGTPFCQGNGTVMPNQTGEAGGVYSSSAGLIIDPVTGAIDLNSSASGLYTVTYAITGSLHCLPATFDIVINSNTAPVTDFTYPTPVCTLTTVNPMPTGIAGFTPGGVYSSTNGLDINATTGEINIATSTPGTYTVTYTVVATLCKPQGVSVFDITLNPAIQPVVDFDYTTVLCSDATNQLPTLDPGFVTGGTFASTTGLVIDPATGEVNVSTSTAGTYTVTYTLPADASICQAAGTHSATFTILGAVAVDITAGCEGVTYMINAVPVGGSFDPTQVTYSWSGPGGFTGTTQSVVATTMGSYTVTITTPDGCNSSMVKNITPESCMIPKGISPNGDGLNEAFDLDGLNVEHLSIINRYGTTVYEHGEGYTNQWHGQSKNGDHLPDGTYYYVIKTGDGQTRTGWVYINR